MITWKVIGCTYAELEKVLNENADEVYQIIDIDDRQKDDVVVILKGKK